MPWSVVHLQQAGIELRILDRELLSLYHQQLYLYLIMSICFTRCPVLVYGDVYQVRHSFY